MTYIKNYRIFTELKTPHTTNQKLTELQHIKIHLANHKHLNIFNIYIYIYIYIYFFFFACTSGRCNRQSEFTLLHFTIFH